MLSQNKQENAYKKGEGADGSYKHIPNAYDMYGSKQLLRDCTLLIAGFRPNLYQDLRLMQGKTILGIDGEHEDWNTVYLIPQRSRHYNPYVGNVLKATDGFNGFRIKDWLHNEENTF